MVSMINGGELNITTEAFIRVVQNRRTDLSQDSSLILLRGPYVVEIAPSMLGRFRSSRMQNCGFRIRIFDMDVMESFVPNLTMARI